MRVGTSVRRRTLPRRGARRAATTRRVRCMSELPFSARVGPEPELERRNERRSCEERGRRVKVPLNAAEGGEPQPRPVAVGERRGGRRRC